jgi:hypothetical protein
MDDFQFRRLITMDRSDRPPRPPRETPKTSAEEQAEFLASKVARMGADVRCETCFHCYSVRLQPLDRHMTLLCYEGPPEHGLADHGQGVAIQHIPRTVGKGPAAFCYRWKTRD